MSEPRMKPQPMIRRNRSRSCSNIYKSKPSPLKLEEHPLEEIVESIRQFHLNSPKLLSTLEVAQAETTAEFSPISQGVAIEQGNLDGSQIKSTGKEDIFFPKSIISPAKSIISNSDTISRNNSNDQFAIKTIIEGYQSTICKILSVSDDKYQQILTLQQRQLEQFQKQQQERFVFFQQQIIQQ